MSDSTSSVVGHPFRRSRQSPQDGRDADAPTRIVGDDLVDDCCVQDDVEHVEVGLDRRLRHLVLEQIGDPFKDVGNVDRPDRTIAEVWVVVVAQAGVQVTAVVE
jgi:hypothetical protein